MKNCCIKEVRRLDIYYKEQLPSLFETLFEYFEEQLDKEEDIELQILFRNRDRRLLEAQESK